jgi:phosphatidylserine decarboxylase
MYLTVRISFRTSSVNSLINTENYIVSYFTFSNQLTDFWVILYNLSVPIKIILPRLQPFLAVFIIYILSCNAVSTQPRWQDFFATWCTLPIREMTRFVIKDNNYVKSYLD